MLINLNKEEAKKILDDGDVICNGTNNCLKIKMLAYEEYHDLCMLMINKPTGHMKLSEKIEIFNDLFQSKPVMSFSGEYLNKIYAFSLNNVDFLFIVSLKGWTVEVKHKTRNQDREMIMQYILNLFKAKIKALTLTEKD